MQCESGADDRAHRGWLHPISSHRLQLDVSRTKSAISKASSAGRSSDTQVRECSTIANRECGKSSARRLPWSRGKKPGAVGSAADLAAAVNLSTSRFLHLFAAETGTSFRRYRLWARMLHVGAAVAAGDDLTRASIEAGFASPSHFSTAFNAMFGLSAVALLGGGAQVIVMES
ncbi:Transcriptional regulator, AraC [Rhodococcus sp. B7740]|nr:Transcriptional regulator, AraC [Rhodococcus sp. B7740]